MRSGGAACLIVIPARYGSSRLPGKPLLKESGRYLVQHVYEKACAVRGASAVVVATDDARIREAVEGFGGTCVMTSPDCTTGTDRVREAARGRPEDVVVNLQGDEPEMSPAVVEAVVAALNDNPDVPMATAVAPLRDPSDLARPQVVKVVRDARGRALYFSRAPIPHARDAAAGGPAVSAAGAPAYWRHVGLYAYRRPFLDVFAGLPEGRLERLEKLEQLRALEAGYPIQTAEVTYEGINVDTPEDYARFLARRR